MKNATITSALLLLYCLLGSTVHGFAQPLPDDGHIEVALRTIGHKVLLSTGDSVSRVMPIVKEGDRYRIQFGAEFEFQSNTLIEIVDQVVQESGIALKYLVEMEQCETQEVIYSYEMGVGPMRSNFVPCGGRLQPKTCFQLMFTILEPSVPDEAATVEAATNDLPTYTKLSLLSVPLLLAGFAFFTRNQKKEAPIVPTDPNVLAVGQYRFDKRTLELYNGNERMELTGKEAELLMVLHHGVNTTLEREYLLNAVWGDEGDYVGRTLDVFVSKLRKRLQDDAGVKILNIRGVGYRLVIEA